MGKLINGQWVSSEEQTRIGDKGSSSENPSEQGSARSVVGGGTRGDSFPAGGGLGIDLPKKNGDFVRGVTSFRNWIGSDPFPAEAGRYHLLVAHNCPWAHRTVIVRNLKGLRDVIGMSVAHYRRNEDGWWFPEGLDEFQPTEGKLPLHEFYARAEGEYTGSATVPVLWDRQRKTIVSNESAEIIQMLNSEFADFGATPIDLYPDRLKSEIDEVNEWVYQTINNGVYKCGFARTQEAYERAFVPLFASLDKVEARLDRHRYLVGDQLTLADVRLFTTLARFDAVYHGHFKCNLRRIVDYPNMWAYLRDLVQTEGIGETVQLEIYKKGYYGRSPGINPRGIVPLGPAIDFLAPHDRASRAYVT
ncbi:MAG: glutathione S-transferase family protein [Myxococcota bacterium]